MEYYTIPIIWLAVGLYTYLQDSAHSRVLETIDTEAAKKQDLFKQISESENVEEAMISYYQNKSLTISIDKMKISHLKKVSIRNSCILNMNVNEFLKFQGLYPSECRIEVVRRTKYKHPLPFSSSCSSCKTPELKGIANCLDCKNFMNQKEKINKKT